MLKLKGSEDGVTNNNRSTTLVCAFVEENTVYEIYRTPLTTNNNEDADKGPLKGLSLKDWMRSVDKAVISKALSNVKGNKSRAARILKLSRTALIEKCRRYSL